MACSKLDFGVWLWGQVYMMSRGQGSPVWNGCEHKPSRRRKKAIKAPGSRAQEALNEAAWVSLGCLTLNIKEILSVKYTHWLSAFSVSARSWLCGPDAKRWWDLELRMPANLLHCTSNFIAELLVWGQHIQPFGSSSVHVKWITCHAWRPMSVISDPRWLKQEVQESKIILSYRLSSKPA